MKTKFHIAILLVMSSAMAYYLYSYKPRNYEPSGLVLGFVVNIGLWFIIFGAIYLAIFLLITLAKRYFFNS